MQDATKIKKSKSLTSVPYLKGKSQLLILLLLLLLLVR